MGLKWKRMWSNDVNKKENAFDGSSPSVSISVTLDSVRFWVQRYFLALLLGQIFWYLF